MLLAQNKEVDAKTKKIAKQVLKHEHKEQGRARTRTCKPKDVKKAEHVPKHENMHVDVPKV